MYSILIIIIIQGEIIHLILKRYLYPLDTKLAFILFVNQNFKAIILLKRFTIETLIELIFSLCT